MIFFDASYINVGGGKILLDQLVSEIENSNLKVIYLLDKRYKNKNLYNSKNKVQYIQSNLFIRFYYYYKFYSKINKIFIFSGIPPIYNFKVNTICFFQNVLLLNKKANTFKYLYFKFLSYNINIWVVQTNYIKELLNNHINSNNIIIAPFYQKKSNLNLIHLKNKDEIKILYVSSGEKHKNHLRLFECFNKLITIHPKATLTVTISNTYTSLIEQIGKNKNIRNIGNVDKGLLDQEYTNANIFIFPSINESFGLGLIEANQYNLPILASNLQYVKEIVDTPYLFDPNNVDSMYNCILKCIETNYKPSTLKIKNRIDLIFDLIK